VNYCKENNLKTSGKKKEVIHRILAHLKGEPEKTKPVKSKKRKASSGTKKTAKKAKTDREKPEAQEDEATK